jgi:phosphoadenosine phosphosulfate reductase
MTMTTDPQATDRSNNLRPALIERMNQFQALLARELLQDTAAVPVADDRDKACLTCSFQAEDVLLLHLVLQLLPNIPVLFLDTAYHFTETYTYRDRLAADWKLNLHNLQAKQSRAQQEAAFGLLYETAPDKCCGLRKVEPLFTAVAGYRIWLTGLRREQARSRAALEVAADFTLPGGVVVRKLSPFADWTTRDIWELCQHYAIPLLPLYDQGFTSIGCSPCTSIPTDPDDPRSGRWAGKKLECGIHIEAETK